MVYDELLQTDAVSVISKIKSTVWSLNALLQIEQNLLDPGPLLEKKVFPVKDAEEPADWHLQQLTSQSVIANV